MARIYDKDLSDHIIDQYLKVTTPHFDKAMGNRFKLAREKMKLTQKELADLLGLSQTDLSRIENGKMRNAPLTSFEFKSVFGKHFQYVLCRHGYHEYETIKWSENKSLRRNVGSR